MKKVIVVLDFDDIEQMRDCVSKLSPKRCRLKIATTLYTRYGPDLLSELNEAGYEVFLDLKFHDIPKQVYGACKAAAEAGAWMMTVHCSGGVDMLKAAVEAVRQSGNPAAKVVGVTVLTSLSPVQARSIYHHDSVLASVNQFSHWAFDAGLDGVVCSPQEVLSLRQQFPKDFLLVTPGIRLKPVEGDDQQRTLTPKEALAAGSDYLVIGRPITQACHPGEALNAILASVA